jgi:hypothetical protein
MQRDMHNQAVAWLIVLGLSSACASSPTKVSSHDNSMGGTALGTRRKVYATGLQAASFVGPAGVGAMSDPQYQQFVDDTYAEVATLQLAAGTF